MKKIETLPACFAFFWKQNSFFFSTIKLSYHHLLAFLNLFIFISLFHPPKMLYASQSPSALHFDASNQDEALKQRQDLIPEDFEEQRISKKRILSSLTKSPMLILAFVMPAAVSATAEKVGDSKEQSNFNVAITAIFVREILEGAVIVNNYWKIANQLTEQEQKTRCKKTIIRATVVSIGTATVLITGLGFGLYHAGQELDEKTVEVVEGFSKLLASFSIAHMSFKIPKWFNLKDSTAQLESSDQVETLPTTEFNEAKMKFDIAWNLVREWAEVGVFLLPFLLAGEVESLPLSSLAGLGISGLFGTGLFFIDKCLSPKAICSFSISLTCLLATGLFSGALHELEEAWGETPKVFDLGEQWSHKKLPGAIPAALFGYSKSPTVLQAAAWGTFASSLMISHLFLSKKGFKAGGKQLRKIHPELKHDDLESGNEEAQEEER